MDNEIIYMKKQQGETEEWYCTQHKKLVHQIFDILEANDLYTKPEKCVFK
jgi:hypothetical protein